MWNKSPPCLNPMLTPSTQETNGVSEFYWLRNLLSELHCPISKATIVYYNNVRTIYIISDIPVHHRYTKNIEINIYFVRETACSHIQILHIHPGYQINDIFTKELPLQLFENFQDSLNIHQHPILTTWLQYLWYFIL
jgi:hypothetical protein